MNVVMILHSVTLSAGTPTFKLVENSFRANRQVKNAISDNIGSRRWHLSRRYNTSQSHRIVDKKAGLSNH